MSVASFNVCFDLHNGLCVFDALEDAHIIKG